MTQPIFEHLTLIRQRATSAPHVLVGLDYDGTLTPLVDNPSNAKLAIQTREILRALAARPATTVAIVSGRALDDLRALVSLDNVIYAGNHGLDISGPGLRFVESTAVAEQGAMNDFARNLAFHLQHIAGAIVENKTLTISVHFRCVAAHDRDRLCRVVENAMAENKSRFRLTRGHKVFEIRPRVDWHKGTAMRWIQERLSRRDAPLFFVGDDETDEDAFHAMPGELTVKVGDPSDTSAHYHVEAPERVCELLVWLEGVLGQADKGVAP